MLQRVRRSLIAGMPPPQARGPDVNAEQAKFVLRGYRAEGFDASDPLFREALREVARNPALAAWFERERNFDAKIGAYLHQVIPPAGLREIILAGVRATEIEIGRQRGGR